MSKTNPKENNMPVKRINSVKHKPFRDTRDGLSVRAIRVTARNYTNVAGWSGGLAIAKEGKDGELSNQRIRVGKLIAQIGDVVVREVVGEKDGKPVHKFYRVKADVFAAYYVPVK